MGKDIKKVTTRTVLPSPRGRRTQTRSSASLSGVRAPLVEHFTSPEAVAVPPKKKHIVHRAVHKFINWGPVVRVYISVGEKKRRTMQALLAVPYRVILASVLLICLIGGFVILKNVGNAEVAMYYPTACLGGWANPQLAEGEFKSTEVVNAENSAMYAGGEQTIFCGSFKGSLLENVELDTVTLTLGLSQVELNQAALSGYIETPQLQTEAGATESEVPSTEIESAPTATGTTETEVSPVPTAASAAESAPEAITPEAPASAVPESAPAVVEPSAWHSVKDSVVSWLIATARAQEVEQAAATEAVGATSDVPATQSDAPTAETVIPSPVNDSAAAPVDDSVEGQTVPSATPSVGESVTSTEADVFSVRYSVDGSTWQELGSVGLRTFSKTFSVPVLSLPDLAQMQVSIVPLVQVSLAAPVFLNGMRLDVIYAEKGARTPPTPDTDVLLDVKSSGDISLLKVQNNERDTVALWVYDRKGTPQWQYVAAPNEVSISFPIALLGPYAFWISGDGLSLAGYHVGSQTYFSSSLASTEGAVGRLAFDQGKSVSFEAGVFVFRDEGGELLVEDDVATLSESLRKWFTEALIPESTVDVVESGGQNLELETENAKLQSDLEVIPTPESVTPSESTTETSAGVPTEESTTPASSTAVPISGDAPAESVE